MRTYFEHPSYASLRPAEIVGAELLAGLDHAERARYARGELNWLVLQRHPDRRAVRFWSTVYTTERRLAAAVR